MLIEAPVSITLARTLEWYDLFGLEPLRVKMLLLLAFVVREPAVLTISAVPVGKVSARPPLGFLIVRVFALVTIAAVPAGEEPARALLLPSVIPAPRRIASRRRAIPRRMPLRAAIEAEVILSTELGALLMIP